MVVVTGVAVGVIIFSGGAATPGVVAVVAEGCAAGSAASGAVAAGAATTGTAVACAGGTAAAAGAATGAAAGGTVTSAIVGSVVGGTTATGVAATGGGAATAVTTGLVAGPVGWICLGVDSQSMDVTYDCWKPLLHDTSTEPSKGMLLRDVLLDNRIKSATISSLHYDVTDIYPEIRILNIWDEEFKVEYVQLPSGQIAAHALPVTN